MLAFHRRQHALVVDAGVGEDHAERGHRSGGAALEVDDPLRVLDALEAREIGAARVGDGRRHDPALALGRLGQLLEEGDPRRTERLGVGAQMDLADLDEVLGVEELADRDLLLDREAPRLAELARAHPSLQVVQLHAAPSSPSPG